MSQIKISYYDTNEDYLKRLVSVMTQKYPNRFSISSFTSFDLLLENLRDENSDIVLIDEKANRNVLSPFNIPIVVLVDSEQENHFNDSLEIFRFQKVDNIYKNILDIVYKCNKEDISVGFNKTNTKILTFMSSVGGSGSSTLAASISMYLSKKQHKILYLSLDSFDTPTVFFHGEGTEGLSELIIAIKNKRNNFKIKLESTIKQDECGVYFVNETASTMDLFELTSIEFTELVKECLYSNIFDYFVIDNKILSTEFMEYILLNSEKVLLITKEEHESIFKLSRFYQYIQSISLMKRIDVLQKVLLVTNFSSNNIPIDFINEGNIIGNIPRYPLHSSKKLAQQLSNSIEIKKICDKL